MTTISIRVSKDVIDDLKEIAPGVRLLRLPAIDSHVHWPEATKDLERLERTAQLLAESWRRHGLSEGAIAEVIAETQRNSA